MAKMTAHKFKCEKLIYPKIKSGLDKKPYPNENPNMQ